MRIRMYRRSEKQMFNFPCMPIWKERVPILRNLSKLRPFALTSIDELLVSICRTHLTDLYDTKNAFFACFRPYVGQPHCHTGWVTLMPFASINPTNPRTHPTQFGKKILRIDRLAKWGFFESAILDFFFEKKKFFLLNPMKNSQRFLDSKDGSKFWWLPWFPAF